MIYVMSPLTGSSARNYQILNKFGELREWCAAPKMVCTISGARWNLELAAKPGVKFRLIWVFTAKFVKIKGFKQKNGKSVYKMQFLQQILALFFDLNNLNGLKKSSYSVISIFEILIPVTFYSLATKK